MPGTEQDPRGDSPHMAIANAVVGITRDYTGRGPTKARTTIGEDLITVVMRDTLTKGEAKLVEMGRAPHVRATRREFQEAMREEMCGSVEKITGRRVIGFLSDASVDPDLAIEAFVLEPHPSAADAP